MFKSSLLVSLVTFFGLTQGQSCSSIVTRPEIRSLSSSRLTAFLNAVKKLTNQGGVNVYLQSSAIHYNNVPQAHGAPAFLPWHRKFIRNYEVALQAIDPSIVLPYWDWSIDSQAPENSPVLGNSYFGGNGRSSDNCVVQGPFSGWNSTIPSSHCLKRQYNQGSTISSFYSPEALEAILTQSTTYDQLRQGIEGGPHGAVHNGIGGNNGDFSQMYSTNDPIFYMHHAFVDLLWNEWQKRNPSIASTYNGGSVSSSNNMIPFNVPVSSTFSTTASGYCYTYPRYSANLPATSQVPAPQASSSQPAPTQAPATQPQFTQVPVAQTTQAPAAAQPQSNPFPTFSFPTFSSPASNNFAFPTFTPGTFLTRRQFSSTSGLTNLLNILTSNVAQLISIAPTDRTTRGKIRTPAPLPDSYIAMNNLDVQQVRSQESNLAKIVEALNGLKDFIPKADLY